MNVTEIEFTIDILRLIIQMNDTIAEHEKRLDTAIIDAQKHATHTYIKGLTKQKILDSLADEASCREMIKYLREKLQEAKREQEDREPPSNYSPDQSRYEHWKYLYTPTWPYGERPVDDIDESY